VVNTKFSLPHNLRKAILAWDNTKGKPNQGEWPEEDMIVTLLPLVRSETNKYKQVRADARKAAGETHTGVGPRKPRKVTAFTERTLKYREGQRLAREAAERFLSDAI